MRIQRKHTPALSDLVRQLSRDPSLKRVIAKVRHQSRGKGRTELEKVTDLYLVLVAIMAQFSRKKRARTLEEHMNVVAFLVQLSLAVKENIFDRPEVKQFFDRSSKEVYRAVRKCIAMLVPEKGPSGSRARHAVAKSWNAVR